MCCGLLQCVTVAVMFGLVKLSVLCHFCIFGYMVDSSIIYRLQGKLASLIVCQIAELIFSSDVGSVLEQAEEENQGRLATHIILNMEVKT